jgi:hypothetical protein
MARLALSTNLGCTTLMMPRDIHMVVEFVLFSDQHHYRGVKH